MFGQKKSILDLWLSTYLHLVTGYKKYDRLDDGSLEASSKGGGIGFSWGLILTATMMSIDMELGSFNEFFFRFGFGLSFNLL